MARKRLGELLVEHGALSQELLDDALTLQTTTKQRLGALLVHRGFVTEDTLVAVLSEALGVPAVDLKRVQPEWRAIHMLRATFCEANDLFPFMVATEGGKKQLVVAMADPSNAAAISEIEFTTGLSVAPRLAALSTVRAALLRYYHRVAPAEALSQGRTQAGELMARPAPSPAPKPKPLTGRKGAVRVVNDEPLTSVTAPIGMPLQQNEGTDPGIIVGEEILTPATELPANEVELLARERERAAAAKRVAAGDISKDLAFLTGQKPTDEALEQKFWALVRILARKGLITKEEFHQELDEGTKG